MRTIDRRAGLLALAVMLVAACGGPADPDAGTAFSVLPRAGALASLPKVELVAPGGQNAGLAPTFEWRSVADAATYRLSVLGPDAPRWAWSGSATSVRYGGVAEGVSGPSLVAGSWWSVAALDAEGNVLALSDLRSVSPGLDAGPAPAWTSVQPVTSEPTKAPTGPAGARACDLLSTQEIHDAIGGTWNEPELEVYPSGAASACSWDSEKGSNFSVSILDESSYDPEGWASDGEVEGLGERAFAVTHGWDRRIGFVHGEHSVTLLIDYTRVDLEGFYNLAKLVDDRLP